MPTTLDHYQADLEVDGKHIQLLLCDTPGIEELDNVLHMMYPESHVIVLCFSVVVPYALSNIKEKWISEVRRFCPGVPIILVGCQTDLRHDPSEIEELRRTNERPITFEEGVIFAQEIGATRYLECSAKMGVGVHEVFRHAARASLLNSPGDLDEPNKSRCIIQ
ncbi:hypothetical protein CVT24_003188 [Panaeolus cyanescens]|uniref:Uncharacterized protein n=1 Tax=Panaeolus cyanescens TaxID=181874 RepID=A0A409W8J4_9AGAR|nr:hypothetical protein CVT24_003188 [Panaeolus cyanescens]